MLRAKTETPGRGTVAGFVGGCNLINNALGLVVSQGYEKSQQSRAEER